MSTNKSVLTKASLAAVLATTAIVPTAVASAAETNPYEISSIGLNVNGKVLTLSQGEYQLALLKGEVSSSDIAYIGAGNGEYFSQATYQLELLKNGTPEKALEVLSENGSAQDSSDFIEGKIENGELVPKNEEETPGETEIKVESVSAINNTTFELGVTLANAEKEDAPASLTLKHGETGETVTATFVKFEEGVATYKVNKADLVNGAYTITASGLDFSGHTTAYSEVITGNYVEGFVYDNASTPKPVEGATVKVGNETATTNEHGYYKIATNPGLKTVEIFKGTKYFVEEVPNVTVQRNYSTVSNVDLEEVDVKKLIVEGTVLNDKDSSPVVGASVQLQTKDANGEWSNIKGYTTDTVAGGKYSFGNTNSSATISTDDVLEIGKEYRVVVERNVEAKNLDKVFHTQEQVFTTSNKTAKTEFLTKLTEVKELKSLALDLTWASDVTGTANANIEFIDTDGETVLEEITSATFSKANATDRKLSEAYDLVKAPGFANATANNNPSDPVANSGNAVNPRLVSGTYFLRINDGANAISIVPVEITEGKDAKVSAEIQKTQSVQMNANVLNVKYPESLLTNPTTSSADMTDYLGNSVAEDLTQIKADNTRDTTNVDVTYNVYQEVAGKKVFVTNKPAEDVKAEQKVGASTPADIKLAPAAVGLDKLAAGTTYTIEATSDYVSGNKEITKKVEDNAIQGETLSVSAAAKLAEIKLGDEASTATNVEVNNIKLINKAGKVVKESGAFESTNTAAGNILTGDMADVFAGIPADEYKIEIDVKGYEVETTTLEKILDFQNAEVSVDLKAIKDPIVTGYVRFADNGENVDSVTTSVDATVIAYNEKGEAVAGTDLAQGDATYKIDSDLKDGKTYTFVVRGNGFETQAITRTVKNGENLALNFDVVRGGQGMFKYTIVDSNNNTLSGITTADPNTDFVITDSYYDKAQSPASLGSLEFEGTGILSSTDGKTFTSAEALSKDSYKLSIAASTNTNKYSTSLTINDINGTEYGTIKVPAKTSDLTAEIEVTITGAVVESSTSTDLDYVILVDENGTPVGEPIRQSIHTDSGGATNIVKFQAPVNAKYEVHAYLKDGFVAKSPVTVQDFDQKVSVVVDQAER